MTTSPTEQLDAQLQRWRQADIDDALDDIDGALEELIDYAKGDRSYPDAPGTQAMEVDQLANLVLTALARLRHSRTTVPT